MPGIKVLIVDVNYPNYEEEARVLASFSPSIIHLKANGDSSVIRASAKDADAIMVREAHLDGETINGLEKCKVIVRYGVGVDNIDLEAAKARRIVVANVPVYGKEEVADHALALLLAVSRRIVSRDAAVRRGAWGISYREPIYSFHGKTLGLVGLGRIGTAFLKKAMTLNFAKALIYDPFLKTVPKGAELVPLEVVMAESDVVSIHAPLTQNNKNLIDATAIHSMKKGAIIINTSRGGLVDEKALAEALENGKLFGAGIDVYEKEPPDINCKLFKLNNVILTDHTGWYSEESMHDLQAKAADEVLRVLSGKEPRSWVNRW